MYYPYPGYAMASLGFRHGLPASGQIETGPPFFNGPDADIARPWLPLGATSVLAISRKVLRFRDDLFMKA